MKYFKSVLFIIVIVLFVQVKVFSGITGSAHDFSSYYGLLYSHGYETKEICKVCHVPHNAGSSLVPLWRGGMQPAYRIYTTYSSVTMNAATNQPSGATLGCLTCHDGTIANSREGKCEACHKWSKEYSEDFRGNHPVSFTYDSALAQADGELKNPSEATVSVLGGKTIKESMLYQNRLECPSCHDVHATKGDSATAPHLLLVNNKDDKLCLTCHIK